jgi:hypothetical protein
MKVGSDRTVPESPCTACGHKLDGATCVGDDKMPKPGDISVCIRCGHLMAFGDDLMLRNLTNEEMHDVAGDPYIIAIQKARAQLDKRG